MIPRVEVHGLAAAEAQERLARFGPNELPAQKRPSILRQVWMVLREPMILLLLAAAAVSFLLTEPIDSAILLASVVFVVAISLYQQHKTVNALAALRDLSAPRALVVRDGVEIRIPGRDVVPGDLVLLAEGDRVPADGVALASTNLRVDESALTGESVPVLKGSTAEVTSEMGPPGGEGTPWLFSGTLVVGGHGEVVVHRTGGATEFGRIGHALSDQGESRTRLQREFDRLVIIFASVAFTTAVLVVVIYGWTRGDWLQGALAGITTAMAVIPEEFPVVFSVFLALGAWRMARRKVLARNPPAIESLGSVTVLCVDKTGTLTSNDMTVWDVAIDGVSQRVADGLDDAAIDLARVAALACPRTVVDPMDRAFVRLADEFAPDWRDGVGELLWEYPLSPDQLSVAQAWRLPDGRALVAMKGAPETVMRAAHLPSDQRVDYEAAITSASANGLRILGVAVAILDAAELPTEQRDLPVRMLGLAGLRDPVRPGVPDAVQTCARAGIRTVMITGDYPGTAMAIAREIGIPTDAGCLTGADLDQMNDAELADAARRVNVFARMVPERKLALVNALQADGEVVGMTGDGVNDAPALRASDIGIAMGGRGTDVAREAADLVVVDDDFASIAGSVRQGRGVFANLRKALTYIISVHVPIYGIALIPVFVADWPLVLLPVEVVILELIIDPACTVVFENEKVSPTIMEDEPRSATAPMFGVREFIVALAQGAVLLAVVLVVYVGSLFSGMADESVRSITFVTLVTGNVALILANRSRHISAVRALFTRSNPALLVILALAASVLLVLIAVPPVRAVLQLGSLTPLQWTIGIVAGLSSIVWFEVYRWFGRRREPREAAPRPLR